MASFNVAAVTKVNLTPWTFNQSLARTDLALDSESHLVTFSFKAFNTKRPPGSPFTSLDYWRYQNSSLSFSHRNTVIHSRATLKGISSFTFNNELHLIQHITPHGYALTGSSSIGITVGHVMGRSRSRGRSHGLNFNQFDRITYTAAYALGATLALTFTPVGAVRHNYKSKTGVSSITFTSGGGTVNGRLLTGVSSLTFGSVGGVYPLSLTSAVHSLSFTIGNSLSVTKNVSAAHALSIQSGGYCIV